MASIPEDLLYTSEHEWLRVHRNGTATIGITDYAQESLGDITFVEFPQTGAALEAGDAFGVVESVKAASDLYMPVKAEVLEVNEAVEASPELLNGDPYGEGWLIKIRVLDESELEGLLKPADYAGIT